VAQAASSIDVSASPNEVWELIGGFGSFPDWLPYILKSELSEGGRVRYLATPTGDTIIEPCVSTMIALVLRKGKNARKKNH
jgi:hypothetical protein